MRMTRVVIASSDPLLSSSLCEGEIRVSSMRASKVRGGNVKFNKAYRRQDDGGDDTRELEQGKVEGEYNESQ